MKKACVVGSLNYDLIVRQPRFALEGETLSAESVWSGGGGKGANQAVQLAKLGIPTCLIGAIGKDVFGPLLLEELSTAGVDISGVSTLESSSGIGIINSIPDGRLTASILPGANALLSPLHIEKNLKIIKNSDIILYQLETPIETTLYSFKQHNKNTYTVLNAAPALALPAELWNYINCLIVNEVEAAFYAGQAIASLDTAVSAANILKKMLPSRVSFVITLGSMGALACNHHTVEHIPALKVPVVETTGAGDSFTGAFAYAHISGYNFLQAVEFGVKAASFTVQGMGAQASMPFAKQILK